jgi:hypothetical protein
MGNVVVIERNRAKLTNILATVSETSAAGIGYFKSSNRTLVTGYVNDLNNIGIVFITAHGNLDTLTKYGALLVNAATHCCFLSGGKPCGNIHNILKKSVIPSQTRNFA